MKNLKNSYRQIYAIMLVLLALLSASAARAQTPLIYADTFNTFNTTIWSCEYSCPTAQDSKAQFRLDAGIQPNNYGSWSKIRYKPQRFTSGSFKVRFALSNRPNRAVWWGVALWDDGPTADMSQFNEINFGYTANQSFTNSQLYFESAKDGVATSVKIDTGFDLYDGQYHEAELRYNQDFVAFYLDGKLMHTITDKRFIPTAPMDFIVGPRLVTGSAPLTTPFTEFVDWVEISNNVTPPPTGPQVTVFEHCNYGGYSAALALGSYDTAALAALGVKDNQLSSIQVPEGVTVTLYDGNHFTGNILELKTNDSCFVSAGFNDVVSSVKVEKNVVVNAITSPQENGRYDLTTGVPFSFTTNSDVARVLLYYSDEWIDIANLHSPYTFTWYPPAVGNHVVHYEFYDANWNFISGGSRQIQVSASTRLSLTTITANAVLTGTVHINALASDPTIGSSDGDGIQRVDFQLVKNGLVVASRVENFAPYDWYFTTNGLTNGAYTLTVTATKTSDGKADSISIPITIAN